MVWSDVVVALNNKSPSSGEFILKQLQRFGLDTNSKHEVSLWLYFPDLERANQAASRIRRTGLEVDVSESATDTKWLCLVYCPHIPDEKILDGIIDLLTDATQQYGGIFDGWETSLEGDNISIPAGGSKPEG